MTTPKPAEHQLTNTLILLLEMNGVEGVKEYAQHHGLTWAECREVLDKELTGQPPAQRRIDQDRNR